MSKNILIFADGTGQGGGVLLDERRSNVYKLFRATRSGPETSIPPDKQIAFYDPGLGSSRDNEHIRSTLKRRIYNFFAKATGLGITRNIIDCYAFAVQHYEPGDRVYLYGFSRGAYTARCVGGVMAYCGLPVMEDGKPVKRDPATARRIAEEAVKDVYQHGVGRKSVRFAEQRKQLAAKFRERFGSAAIKDGEPQGWSNEVPYLIGVWDTVAALGLSKLRLFAFFLIIAALSCIALTGLFLVLDQFGWLPPLTDPIYYAFWVTVAGALLAIATYFLIRIRWTTETDDPWWKTLHLRRWKMKFYDNYLNPRVQYAKHAISIDENRKDFARVPWTDDNHKNQKYKAEDWFEQIWFSGVHSDIGGSYPETESRLSDIALEWIVDASTAAKHPILVDSHYLRLYPDPAGIQHDERKSGRVPFGEGFRSPQNDAPLHPSVLARFEVPEVVHYDEVKPYRPYVLRDHKQVKHYYK